jgi:hypothetical protein
MEIAQRKIFSDGGVRDPESGSTVTSIQSFNGIKAIQEHLDHIVRLKEYLCARTKQIPDVPLSCYSECQVAQWLRGESGRECANHDLIVAACKRCEEFNEVAAQSVMRTQMDLPEPVRDVLQAALDFENTSSRFQKALADLHLECTLNQ